MEIDGIPTLAQAFDLEQSRRIRAEERVEVLEAAMEFHADPLDPGSYAHTIMVLEGRVGELEAALENERIALEACGSVLLPTTQQVLEKGNENATDPR